MAHSLISPVDDSCLSDGYADAIPVFWGSKHLYSCLRLRHPYLRLHIRCQAECLMLQVSGASLWTMFAFPPITICRIWLQIVVLGLADCSVVKVPVLFDVGPCLIINLHIKLQGAC